MTVLDKIAAAGVVGAGGAGFPTHAKLRTRADIVVANGAECEPLLRVDRLLMEYNAAEIVAGLEIAMEQVQAKEGILFLKAHYAEAADALQNRLGGNMRLLPSKSYYPAGDEQQIIYQATRRVVPPGGLPRDVGCVVLNVGTLANIAAAVEGRPVTDRMITVGGAVNNPVTLRLPVGTPMSMLPAWAGGLQEDCHYIIGGPCMGTMTESLEGQLVTKTTGGLLALPKRHPLAPQKSEEIQYSATLSVCCQCNMCTQLCPRQALGLGTSPHKAMRSLAAGTDLIGNVNAVMTCCDCGLCTYFACNFGLNPALVMRRMKKAMADKGIGPDRKSLHSPDFYIDNKRLSANRLVARMGLRRYDLPAPYDRSPKSVPLVRIPLKMHIGAAARPVVKPGDRVEHGAPIAEPPDGALGARIHAGIGGTVTEVSDHIEIRG